MKGSLAAIAVAAVAGPTPAQVARAIHRATHSRTLWATVNVCNSGTGTVGIRGQMPALGFPARLEMTVRLRYFDAKTGRFEPVPGVAKPMRLGTFAHGTVQDGVKFTFTPPATIAGTITFQWRRGRKLLGSAVRRTRGGVSGVDDSAPRGYSAASCRLLAS